MCNALQYNIANIVAIIIIDVLKIIYIYYDHCLNIICALKMLVIIAAIVNTG
ncbi:unknown [Oscillibacter sp. CAG:155]|nr:unknown [Oscillibacter sp. CAG:155]